VEIEVNGQKEIKPVITRTPAEARKIIRLEYGAEARILTVIEDKKK